MEKVHELLDHWYALQDEGKVAPQYTGCPAKDFIKRDPWKKSRADPKPYEEGEGIEGKGKAPDAVTGSAADVLDDNAPFPMIHKPADDKIFYLKTLFKDPDYLKMVDALVSSDKVFHFMKIVIEWY